MYEVIDGDKQSGHTVWGDHFCLKLPIYGSRYGCRLHILEV